MQHPPCQTRSRVCCRRFVDLDEVALGVDESSIPPTLIRDEYRDEVGRWEHVSTKALSGHQVCGSSEYTCAFWFLLPLSDSEKAVSAVVCGVYVVSRAERLTLRVEYYNYDSYHRPAAGLKTVS